MLGFESIVGRYNVYLVLYIIYICAFINLYISIIEQVAGTEAYHLKGIMLGGVSLFANLLYIRRLDRYKWL